MCIFGDTGTGSDDQYKIAKVMESYGCNQIIHTGDIFYPKGVKSETDQQWISKFENPYKDLISNGATFYMTLGNHDYYGGLSSNKVENIHHNYSIKHDYYFFPSRYYKFKMNKTCFWAIDSEKYDKAQSDYLQTTMPKEKCNWKIVIGHHPIKSSGTHGNGSWNLQKYLKPILESEADFYISGHDHNLADEGEVSSSGNGYFTQLVSGAGAQTRPVKSCSNTGCNFISDSLGFIKLEITDSTFGVKIIDENGTVIYSREYTK